MSFGRFTIIDELAGDEAARLSRLTEFEKKYKVVRLREDVDALRVIYSKGLDQLSAHQRELLVERHRWFWAGGGFAWIACKRRAAAGRRFAPAGRAVFDWRGWRFLAGFVAAGYGVLPLAILGIVFSRAGEIGWNAYQPPGVERLRDLMWRAFCALSVGDGWAGR